MTRYTGAERKEIMLDVGAKLAAKHGSSNITRRMVAKAAKVSEALVSLHIGDVETLQKLVKARAKKLGLVEPSKDQQEAIGIKLRAHGPREVKSTRKRAPKEVKAIKKAVAKKGNKMIPKSKGPVAKPAPGKLIDKTATKGSKPAVKSVTVKSTAKAGNTVVKSKVKAGAPGPAETKPAPKPKSKPVAPKAKPVAPAIAPLPAPSEVKAAPLPKLPPAGGLLPLP